MGVGTSVRPAVNGRHPNPPPRRARRARAGGAGLDRDDLERLRYALGRRSIDPRQSLYGPGSLTWKVNREATLLLTGGRALLLQIAHPLVVAGVAAHSDFRRSPLLRLQRTLELTLTTVFSSAAEAVRAVRTIERVHARVHGVLDEDSGPFPRGTAYDANDPALLMWVQATLLDSAMLGYEHFVGRLSPHEQAAFYDEALVGARLFGIPADHIPPTLPDFRAYMRDMLRGPVLAVGSASRAIAASLLDPPLPPVLRQLAGSTRLFTVGLLPATIRRRYGYPWTPARERALRLITAAIRAALPALPRLARQFPAARRAGA